jgi:tRNA-binding EMAP/Myf-like protein
MMNESRKLVTIRRVASVEPIPGADKIEKITVDGWELVTQKGNFKAGDLCVYAEIDSFLPVRPEFEFLRKACFKSTKNLGDGFRIKTIKLRGQVSQGLSLPLADFFALNKETGEYAIAHDAPDDTHTGGIRYEVITEGMDVTEYFGVQKYEKPVPANLAGTVKGNFPSFLHKTDQERIQNCYRSIENWIKYGKSEVVEITDPDTIANLEAGFEVVDGDQVITAFKSGDMWFERKFIENDEDAINDRSLFEATIKLDGSSMTVYHKDQTYGVCSRNLDLKRDLDNVFWKTAISGRVIEALVTIGRNVALQGEVMGPGVQGNREGFDFHRFFVFDVFDIDAGKYLTHQERMEFMKKLEALWHRDVCTHVMIINVIDFRNFKSVADFIQYADKPSIRHPVGEGVVFKSMVDGSVSFKAINNHFLLTEKD